MSNTEDDTLPMNGGGDESNRDTAPLLKEIRADLTQLISLTRQRWTRDDEFQAEVRQRLHEIEVQVG